MLQVVTGSPNWQKRFNEAKEKMNNLRGYDAHVMSSTNDSTEQTAILITLSWMREWENQLYAKLGCECPLATTMR